MCIYIYARGRATKHNHLQASLYKIVSAGGAAAEAQRVPLLLSLTKLVGKEPFKKYTSIMKSLRELCSSLTLSISLCCCIFDKTNIIKERGKKEEEEEVAASPRSYIHTYMYSLRAGRERRIQLRFNSAEGNQRAAARLSSLHPSERSIGIGQAKRGNSLGLL